MVRRNQSGMTLLEVVVALTIFWMIVGGMAFLFVQTKDIADKARDHYVAVNLAKNRLERAGAFDFTALGFLTETNVVVDVNGAPDTAGSYRRTTTVTAVPASTNLAEVVVKVEVKNRRTDAFTGEAEELRTYFTVYLVP